MMEEILITLRIDSVKALDIIGFDLFKKYPKERVYNIIINGLIMDECVRREEIEKNGE